MRKTIGRTFEAPKNRTEGDESEAQLFLLSSGRKVYFKQVIIPAEEVEEKTFVVQETNGRDQLALTPESLKNITKTIKFQQFFPCIGIERPENKIEIIDGSRRRASAILVNAPLKVLVTKSALTTEEARQLARDIQTALEHNLREIGLRLQSLKAAGYNQKEIAQLEGLSQAKVTRALQAASVSNELVSVFPIQAELSFSDYKTLNGIEETLTNKNQSLDDLLKNIQPELQTVQADSSLADDEIKHRFMQIISRELRLLTQESKDRALVSSLWSFQNKDQFARKREKGRMFTYEFNRLSRELQSELDTAIAGVLKKHLN
ncbi:Chromosome partitioning protein ParB (plasmid) [Paramixta manurensis]|uniref:Chromosome partitioning protein ParB n=1 Tax=Paramixta manurensis TaxID=2740817 RepID=A0A6M8UR51_9GAMM|nr:Chromosome partitioning protein ParB [Erwiniaceae bacterium PD-1]